MLRIAKPRDGHAPIVGVHFQHSRVRVSPLAKPATIAKSN
jgi:hypothetical protein